MKNARWTSAAAVAALLALPGAALAQSTPSTPPQNPPSQQQPPPSQPPAQPPSAAQPPAGQVDAAAAKDHLSKARDTLSAITSMPEAAKLQGETRTVVAQLISNFNGLITTQSDWRSAYDKVNQNVTALLGPDTPPDQPVGTSGTAALDPAIRAKLAEFRTHLKAFESAAGGAAPAPGAMPPSAPTPTTSNPANPASPTNPANPSNPPGAAGVSPSSPTAGMDPADRAKATAEVNAAANGDAQKELDAISSILSASKTGALTKAQTTQLKKHVETLRALLAQR